MICCKELWSIISGRSSLLLPEEISKVLVDNEERFHNGLAAFKNASEESYLELKKKSSSKGLELVLKLSALLNLDAIQAQELFQSFVRTEFRGTSRQLQRQLEQSSFPEELVLQVVSFYLRERVFLLRCIKYILTYSQHPECLFQAEFATCVKNLVSRGFITKILEQLKDRCKAGMIHAGIKENAQLEGIFAYQGLLEQYEMLQIVLVYHKDAKPSGEALVDIANFFQSTNFGIKQADKRHLGSSANCLLDSIGFVSCLILLEGFDLEFLGNVWKQERCVSDHKIFESMDTVKKLDEIFCNWDESAHLSAVLLAWALARYHARQGEEEAFEDFGKTAVAFDVFGYLSTLLQWASSSLSEVMSNWVKYVICWLLDLTFIVFHVDSFNNLEIIQRLFREVAFISGLPRKYKKQMKKSGVEILLELGEHQFPYTLCPFLDTMATCIHDVDSGLRVYKYLSKMDWIAELYDDNCQDEIATSEDPNILIRLNDRGVIRCGDDSIIIPKGSLGIVSELPNGQHLIRWNVRYSCWHFLLLELKANIEHSFYFEKLAGCAENVTERLTSIFKLLRNTIKVIWEKAEDLNDLISEIFLVINRFSPMPSPPLELLEACLETLAVVARELPMQVLGQLSEIGFLPECNIGQSSFLGKSDIKLTAGSFGHLLATAECQLGIYPVTKSYLKIMKTILDAKEAFSCIETFQVVLGNVVFIIKEIFSGILSWRFTILTEKDVLVELALELFYKLLAPQSVAHSLSPQSVKLMSAVHSLLCDGILNGEAGDTLLTVLSVGVDFLNQKSFECGSGNGASVSSVQIVKLGLAVLDRLLIKKKEAEMSLLESKVCDAWALHNSSEKSSFVSNIAKYIYHEDDPKLATLAMVVLQRICFINSVSIIACFGSDAFSLRRAIVSCLESNTKPVRLKVAILEFLTCAVDKQPGLLELFINHQLQTGEESLKSKKAFGKPSCLPAVLNFLAIRPAAQPKALQLAALRFVHALWISRMDPVLSIVRKSENFWSNLVATLAVTETETLSCDDVNVLTLLLKVFAMEAFTMTSSVDVSSELQGAIESMQSYDFHRTIKHAIRNSSLADTKRKEQAIASTCSLIRSWTEFTMVTSSVQSKKAKRNSEKVKHFLETLSLFKSEVDKKVSEELSFAVLVLARQWSGSLSNVTRLETEIITLIEMVCSEDDKSLCGVQDHLFSAMLILSSRCVESQDGAELVYNKWLAMLHLICQIIQEISVAVTTSYRPAHFKRLLLMINLVSIASRRFKDRSHLLHIFEEHSVFRHLMNVLGNIKKEPSQKDLVSEILSLSLVFARDSELVAIILRNGFLRLLVVEWNWDYIASPYGNNTDCEHWTIALALVTTLLKTTSHKVLDAAISFIAANKARIIEATKLNSRIKSEALLKESKETSKLFLQLSYFWHKLATMEPELMESLKFEAMMMLHSSVSFLARPRLLQHIVEDRESMQILLEKSRAPSPSLSTDSRHNLQLKEETYYNLDEPLGLVQEMIIEIVASTTGMIRNISPNLVESIIDEGADLQNFVPTVQLVFSFPSLDELREVSFGTFIASINVCHKILMQTAESTTVSPLQESNLFDSHRDKVLRNILNFVIENSVVIIMSEASFYLRHQTINPRTKQFMKRELGSELKNLLHSINRSQSRKVVSQVSKSSGRESPIALRRNASTTTFSENESDNIYEIAYAFACQLLK